MASYDSLINLINAYIKQNGIRAITGNILNGVLNNIVAQIGSGYVYKGTAAPDADPGVTDIPVAYVTATAGTYTNFGGLEVASGELAILRYDGAAWTKETVTTLYQIPQGGIPATDLSQAVQDSLGLADTALQPGDINEEDLTIDQAKGLQFANRVYNSLQPNGLGYKILRKDASFASQVTETNTIYEIRYDFSLGGVTVAIPSGCVLRFNGGSLSNGTINGDIRIDAGEEKILSSVSISGKLEMPLLVEWFGAKGDGVTDDSAAFSEMLSCYSVPQIQHSYNGNGAFPVFLANSGKGYFIHTGIAIRNKNCIFRCTNLIYDGVSAALTIDSLWHSVIDVHGIFHTGTSHWANPNLVAIDAINIQRCRVSVNVIDHFRRGVVVSASTGGAVYSNYFNLNSFLFTLQCFVVKTTGSGWSNHNYVKGGISDYFTGELESDTTPRFLFGIEGGGTYAINSWEFSDNGIEGGVTGHGTLTSYYLYVYSGSKFSESRFYNARIEGINSDCSVILNNATIHSVEFKFFSNEEPTVKNVIGGDVVYTIGGVINPPIKTGANNVGERIVLDYWKDFVTMFGGSRSSNIVPKSPYIGQIDKTTPDIFQYRPGFFMAVYKVAQGTSIIINKIKTGRLGVCLFKADGTGFSSSSEVTGFSFKSLSSSNSPWYGQYENNPTYYWRLADNGDGRWDAEIKFGQNSNVAYIAFIVGTGVAAEVYSIDGTAFLTPFVDREYRCATSNGIENAHSNVEKGERIYLTKNNVFLKVLRDGVVSSIGWRIRGLSVTLTAGSNILTCAENATYMWVGFVGTVDGQKFRVLSISGNDVTMDIVAKENYSGNIVVNDAYVFYEYTVLSADEIAALPIDTSIVKGGLVYNSTTGALMYLNGSTWKSLTGA